MSFDWHRYTGNLQWLPERTIFLTRHGSHAYGTNTPESDEDFKGVAIPPAEYFHGFNCVFEQAESKDPDLVIYEIRKFFKLAADCNPNIIEVLHVDESDILIETPLGRKLRDARDAFLSRKAKFTFSGYAISQLRRIKLHRQYLLNPPSAPPTRAEFKLPERTVIPADQLAAARSAIQKTIDRWEWKDLDTLDEAQKIEIKESFFQRLLEITSWHQQDLEGKVWESSARSLGLDTNFIELLDLERRYHARQREWEQYQNWLKTRNPKRAALEAKYGFDSKHGGHLYRLLTMAKEILQTGKVIVRRPDREVILSIRNGAWSYEQLVEWAGKQDAELDELYRTCTVLPKSPDRAALSRFCQEIVEAAL